MEELEKENNYLTAAQLKEVIKEVIKEEKEEQSKLVLEKQKKLEEEQLQKQKELLENPPAETYGKMQLVDNSGNNIYIKNYTEGLFLQSFIIIFLLIVLIFKRGA